MATFEFEPPEDDRICVEIDGLYEVILARTPKGLVIDVYPKDGEEAVQSLTVLDTDLPKVETKSKLCFEPGSIYVSMGAQEVADEQMIQQILARHLACDWGDVGEEDRKANERALKDGDRLFSSYEIVPDTRLYVVTEWDRSATTVMTPDEY